jgi:hypothetical protein
MPSSTSDHYPTRRTLSHVPACRPTPDPAPSPNTSTLGPSYQTSRTLDSLEDARTVPRSTTPTDPLPSTTPTASPPLKATTRLHTLHGPLRLAPSCPPRIRIPYNPISLPRGEMVNAPKLPPTPPVRAAPLSFAPMPKWQADQRATSKAEPSSASPNVRDPRIRAKLLRGEPVRDHRAGPAAPRCLDASVRRGEVANTSTVFGPVNSTVAPTAANSKIVKDRVWSIDVRPKPTGDPRLRKTASTHTRLVKMGGSSTRPPGIEQVTVKDATIPPSLAPPVPFRAMGTTGTTTAVARSSAVPSNSFVDATGPLESIAAPLQSGTIEERAPPRRPPQLLVKAGVPLRLYLEEGKPRLVGALTEVVVSRCFILPLLNTHPGSTCTATQPKRLI